jgi:hypothetical protein
MTLEEITRRRNAAKEAAHKLAQNTEHYHAFIRSANVNGVRWWQWPQVWLCMWHSRRLTAAFQRVAELEHQRLKMLLNEGR